MATNLLLGRPVIPHAATSFAIQKDTGASYTGSAATGAPETNLFGGNRTDSFRMTNAYTNLLLAFTLPSALTADFFFLGNANTLKGNGATRVILAYRSSSSYSGSTAAFDINPLSGETLRGPASEDILRTFTETSAFVYWWVEIVGGATTKYPFSKLFFGKSFDMGRDPDEDGGFVTTRIRPTGARRRAAYAFDITWTGVTYAKAVEFYDTFVRRRRYAPVILFTTVYHELLNDHRGIYCRLISASMPPRVTGSNDITARFEEIV